MEFLFNIFHFLIVILGEIFKKIRQIDLLFYEFFWPGLFIFWTTIEKHGVFNLRPFQFEGKNKVISELALLHVPTSNAFFSRLVI